MSQSLIKSFSPLTVLAGNSHPRSDDPSPVFAGKLSPRSVDPTSVLAGKSTSRIEPPSTLDEFCNIDLDWFKDDLNFNSSSEPKVDSPKNSPHISQARTVEKSDSLSRLEDSSKPEERSFPSDALHLTDFVTPEESSNPSTNVRTAFDPSMNGFTKSGTVNESTKRGFAKPDDESAFSGDTLDLVEYDTMALVAEDSKKRDLSKSITAFDATKHGLSKCENDSTNLDLSKHDESAVSKIIDLCTRLSGRGEVQRVFVSEKKVIA